MTRISNILRNIAIGLAALIVIVLITATQVVQTDWFRSYVRETIITATQDALGGRVEVGSFSFDWRQLRAEVTNFVIHGREPAGAAPFLRAARVQVDLQLFTSPSRWLNVKALRVEQPQANIMTLADGSLNVPQPARKSHSDTTPLETVVDLAVGEFNLSKGTARYNDAVQPLDVRGENLRVQLAYDSLARGYKGNLSLQPLYVVRGQKSPVVFTITLPVVLQRDKISVQGATISTPASKLNITGSLANLKQPATSAQVSGYLSLAELNRLANLSLAVEPGRSEIMIDADAKVANDSIEVQKLHLQLGSSHIDASGLARDAEGAGALDFNSRLELGELVRLTKSTQRLTGQVSLDGKTRFDGKLLELQNLRVRGFGGELTGNATLENFVRYQANGRLQGLSLQGLEQRLGMKPLPYDGTLTGSFEVHGSLDAPQGGVQARANLQIVAGRRGIPLSGRIEADYNAGDGIVRARNSHLALPHSRLNFSGSVQNGLKLELISHDLRDFFAAIPGAPPPVSLDGGALQVNAMVAGTLQDPRINGHAATTRLTIQGRQFDSIATDFAAMKSRASVQNGSLSRGPMRGNFSGTVGLVDWSPKPDRPVALTASVNNGDLADILALAGQKNEGYSGALGAKVNVAGTVGNPTGSADVAVTQGTLARELFDDLQLHVALADQLVRVPSAYLTRGKERIDLNAEFRHPRENFNTGHIQAHVLTNQVELGNVKNLQTRRPGVAGVFQVDATVEGDLSAQQEFRLSDVAADVSAKSLRIDGESFGDVAAKATTSAGTVSYTMSSNFANSQIRATGQTQLEQDYPTNLDASLNGLSLERVLTAAKRPDLPAKGIASGTLHLSGTIKDPRGEAQVDLREAVFYDEPIDRLQIHLVARGTSLEVTQLDATAGSSKVSLSGRFDHPRAAFDQGTFAFQLASSELDLRRIRNAQMRRPGLGGTLEISGEGKGILRAGGAERFTLESLKARIGAIGLRASGHNLGNLELTANGNGGKLDFALHSGLANASIHGKGNATLRGDYPVTAELTFDDLSWLNLQPLVSGGPRSSVDGITSGRITVNGPMSNIDALNASLRLTKLQVQPVQQRVALGTAPLILQNQGDIALSLQKGQLRVESAHVTGPDTDIKLSGTGSSRGQKLDFRLDAKSNLALVRAFSTDLYSAGYLTVTAVVQGNVQKPSVNGKVELRDVAITQDGVPLGISKANGVIVFNGNTASIQSLTGEAGGGKVSVSGSVSRAGNLRFALKVNATGVRARIQQGVSAVATADIKVAGTSEASLVSGLVTIDRLTYLPQTDIGSMLTRSAPPVQSSPDTSPILQNMSLDILVRTSAVTSVQASLAQNLQMNADLRVRGRVSQPGITGSIQLNHGQLAFFGSTYRLSSGTISFFNPNRVEPILNITLETQAKGVTVVLSVTGPVDNMKLSYTSDPPLQFEEIVALLASGKPPTSDPTLLANQPTQPAQTLQQRGETALVSKALADPISNRLQRVFGVSQLKIDPSFTSGSQVPQARVTLQQQVASNILFTYVTALDNPNTQIVRIEWSMNPQWSATVNRDENGIVSVNLLYKKQFR
jgi:translocation and assembly module TamB